MLAFQRIQRPATLPPRRLYTARPDGFGWTPSLINVTQTEARTFEKTAGTGGAWDAAFEENASGGITGDQAVEWTAAITGKSMMIGLKIAANLANPDYTKLSWGAYCAGDSNWYWNDQGALDFAGQSGFLVGVGGRICIRGTVVTMEKLISGVWTVQHTFPTAASAATKYFVGSSLADLTAKFRDVKHYAL